MDLGDALPGRRDSALGGKQEVGIPHGLSAQSFRNRPVKLRQFQGQGFHPVGNPGQSGEVAGDQGVAGAIQNLFKRA